jgi:ATP-dependent helicase Lhr and Lhr-like helicase
VLVNGELAAWIARGGRQVLAWLPEHEPERSRAGAAIAAVLVDHARRAIGRQEGTLVAEIDGGPPEAHPLAAHLVKAGFLPSAAGLQLTRRAAAALALPPDLDSEPVR